MASYVGCFSFTVDAAVVSAIFARIPVNQTVQLFDPLEYLSYPDCESVPFFYIGVGQGLDDPVRGCRSPDSNPITANSTTPNSTVVSAAPMVSLLCPLADFDYSFVSKTPGLCQGFECLGLDGLPCGGCNQTTGATAWARYEVNVPLGTPTANVPGSTTPSPSPSSHAPSTLMGTSTFTLMATSLALFAILFLTAISVVVAIHMHNRRQQSLQRDDPTFKQVMASSSSSIMDSIILSLEPDDRDHEHEYPGGLVRNAHALVAERVADLDNRIAEPAHPIGSALAGAWSGEAIPTEGPAQATRSLPDDDITPMVQERPVSRQFDPHQTDEIEMKIGPIQDRAQVLYEFEDGWIYGINSRTQQR
ncbi:uncharacterized protein BJ171DRAFT_474069 [Polychytrium aggregatum]|uniref:uncharacterized protein n=1 Tax=Polychytrium aggregatum TaxID=110093 RepID=UPI0022FF241E|nr:uncharacterized protein BJ171DRAFT_474069 [Polychytrium aggregatum]KAI9205571.1 hypothetical protein BJ171DRAFT_474069 [Polychytrium aggregatum]